MSMHSEVDLSRFAQGRRVTRLSIAVNVVLTAMQVIVGLVAHSQALVADAMHTLSDIIADFFVLYANRKGAEAADAEHPYGHGRYETAASLVLGLLLAGTGIGILGSAVNRLQNLDQAPVVGVAAVWAAVATLAAKEGLFRYMLAVAERLRSPMLVANAWHARADALSSLVVAVGVAGSLSGYAFADAVAAMVVGGMIIKAGFGFARDAIRELIDTGLEAEEVARIRATIVATPGVFGLHDLRTRRMAHKVLVDAHLQVDPRVSVSEGHRVGELARHRVLKAHHEVLDVLVHVDAEDDVIPVGAGLPGRDELTRRVADLLGPDAPPVERMVLHYLGDRVEVELLLAPAAGSISGERMRRIEAAVQGDAVISRLTISVRAAPQ